MKTKLHVQNIFWLSLIHLLAIVTFIKYFSWSYLALCIFSIFLLAPFGVNLAFHRMLAHRSLRLPQYLEYFLVTLGSALAGGPPLRWTAEHRLHHQYSDTMNDPHNSRQGFWYAHVTHLFRHKEFEDDEKLWMKYIPDLNQDHYYLFLDKYWLVFAVGFLLPLYAIGGMKAVFWLGFTRATIMLHFMWLVNSASHFFGYRNYNTNEHSTNCWWVAVLAMGEGWHNNHHAYPTSAAHGHKWWEFDLTYSWIVLLEKMGLATEVKRPAFLRAEKAPKVVKAV